nr:zinc finger protein 629-like [Dermacentor andersoni]
MAEESNRGNTPPAFTFDDEAMPSTSQEFFEGASGTSDCSTTICDDSFEDLWNAMNSHNDATDVTGHTHVTESGITSAQPVEFRSSIDHAQSSTSRAGMEEASAIPENIASNSDDAWRYQWNTQQRSITDGTYKVDGVTDNGNTSYLHLGSSTSIDHAMAITSPTGMEQAPAVTEGGARIPETTSIDQMKTKYIPADGTSTVSGRTHNTETGSTGFTLPVYSSSGGADNAMASTSYARMGEPSGIFGNDAWSATGAGAREQQQLSGACSNVSSSRDALHGHANEHTGDTAQICNACVLTSVNNSKFVKHCRNSTDGHHKCEACDKSLHLADHLAANYRTHTHDTPYQSPICNKSFRQSKHLNDHKRAHTGEKPHKCHICNKSFRWFRHLDDHKRTHTGEKPYACETCGKSFAQTASLHIHQYTHTDEKPHVCHKCTKRFKTIPHLKRHLNLYCRNGAFV